MIIPIGFHYVDESTTITHQKVLLHWIPIYILLLRGEWYLSNKSIPVRIPAMHGSNEWVETKAIFTMLHYYIYEIIIFPSLPRHVSWILFFLYGHYRRLLVKFDNFLIAWCYLQIHFFKSARNFQLLTSSNPLDFKQLNINTGKTHWKILE